MWSVRNARLTDPSLCFAGYKQGGRPTLQQIRRGSVLQLPPILRNRPQERSPLREVPAGDKAQPGAPRPGQDDIRGAVNH